MNRLDIAKKIIKKYIGAAECGIFDSRNILGDQMSNIYDHDGLKIDICYYYEYFEVFGLSEKEFCDLELYYNKLIR